MMQINNDADFRRALTNMDSGQQRAIPDSIRLPEHIGTE